MTIVIGHTQDCSLMREAFGEPCYCGFAEEGRPDRRVSAVERGVEPAEHHRNSLFSFAGERLEKPDGILLDKASR